MIADKTVLLIQTVGIPRCQYTEYISVILMGRNRFD